MSWSTKSFDTVSVKIPSPSSITKEQILEFLVGNRFQITRLEF